MVTIFRLRVILSALVGFIPINIKAFKNLPKPLNIQEHSLERKVLVLKAPPGSTLSITSHF